MQQLINSFDTQYLLHLKNTYAGHNNTADKNALKHIYDVHGEVAAYDLRDDF